MSDHRLPIYQRLRDELAEKIASRVWLPAEVIPTEAELASSHGIAVGTVRKAIDALVADGLVERQQGRGTFVRRPRFEDSLARFFRHAMVDGQKVPQSRLLDRKVVDAVPEHVRRALKLQPDDSAVRMDRLRLVADKPFVREEIWLPHPRFAALATAAESEIGDLLYPAYERLCGTVVARAEETITIGTGEDDDTRLLGVKSGEPLAVIDRLALDYSGSPLEWRRSRGVAAQFRYKVEIC
jgi:GntR family transcriptional regulator